jgi:hypothetical protein
MSRVPSFLPPVFSSRPLFVSKRIPDERGARAEKNRESAGDGVKERERESFCNKKIKVFLCSSCLYLKRKGVCLICAQTICLFLVLNETPNFRNLCEPVSNIRVTHHLVNCLRHERHLSKVVQILSTKHENKPRAFFPAKPFHFCSSSRQCTSNRPSMAKSPGLQEVHMLQSILSIQPIDHQSNPIFFG